MRRRTVSRGGPARHGRSDRAPSPMHGPDSARPEECSSRSHCKHRPSPSPRLGSAIAPAGEGRGIQPRAIPAPRGEERPSAKIVSGPLRLRHPGEGLCPLRHAARGERAAGRRPAPFPTPPRAIAIVRPSMEPDLRRDDGKGQARRASLCSVASAVRGSCRPEQQRFPRVPNVRVEGGMRQIAERPPGAVPPPTPTPPRTIAIVRPSVDTALRRDDDKGQVRRANPWLSASVVRRSCRHE